MTADISTVWTSASGDEVENMHARHHGMQHILLCHSQEMSMHYFMPLEMEHNLAKVILVLTSSHWR